MENLLSVYCSYSCIVRFWFFFFLYHDIGHVSKQFILLLDQTNCQVDPKSLKFRKNNYGKPEVCVFIVNLLSVTFVWLHFLCAGIYCSLSFLANTEVLSSIFDQVDWQYADDWNLPPLHFNISHTSSLIACGVTVGSPVCI